MTYIGWMYEEFDGTITEANLSDGTTFLVLILSAGRREIPCIYAGATPEQIQDILCRRANFDVIAHYEGDELPAHVEIRAHDVLKQNPDMLRWQGAFTTLVASWED